jgi:hypothetical protein
MKKVAVLVFCMVFLAILVSCGGGNSKQVVSMKGTFWIEDHLVRDVNQSTTGRSRPEMIFNLLAFGKDEDAGKLAFLDDYGEYGEIVNKEYDIDKNGVFTIYLYPKADVLVVKTKQPSEWLTSKDRYVIEGRFENDAITMPSRLPSNNGGRVFTKLSEDELKEFAAELKAEFDAKEEEYSKAMEKYRNGFFGFNN